ncbi:cytosine deaminase [Nocardioides sp. GY 10127]|nr:cytosine deaminase [Nocardioides sp. GY 10127]
MLVHGGTLLPCSPDLPSAVRGWFTVGADGRIDRLEAGDPPPGLRARERLDATGMLVAPGFVSSHSHLFTSAGRGLAHDASLYRWIDESVRHVRAADAEDLYWFARHGAQDVLLAGVTTAYDHCFSGLGFRRTGDGEAAYVEELPDPALHLAQLRGKLDAGLRHVQSTMLGQTPDPEDTLTHLGEQLELTRAAAAGSDLHLGSSVSGSVQWAAGPATAELEAEAMRRYGLSNQPHLLETPHAIEEQRVKWSWYRDAGVLSGDLAARLVLGHFIHADDAMVAEAGEAGAAVSWQPMSNGRLASGVTRIPELRAAGVRLGMGVDDQSCTDVVDPFSNLRTGLALVRATYRDPAALGVEEALLLHTRGAADAIGVADDVGSLTPGRFADFLLVDPRHPDTGPVWDPVATYVLACSLRNLAGVWVGGRQVASGTFLLAEDAAEASREVHSRMARLAARVDGHVPFDVPLTRRSRQPEGAAR